MALLAEANTKGDQFDPSGLQRCFQRADRIAPTSGPLLLEGSNRNLGYSCSRCEFGLSPIQETTSGPALVWFQHDAVTFADLRGERNGFRHIVNGYR